MLKKTWIIYNASLLVVLTILFGIVYYNAVTDSWTSNSAYVGIGSWIFVFHVILLFPVWLIVLWVKRKSMNSKSFLIGLAIFLLSGIPGVSCIVTLIGSAGGQT